MRLRATVVAVYLGVAATMVGWWLALQAAARHRTVTTLLVGYGLPLLVWAGLSTVGRRDGRS